MVDRPLASFVAHAVRNRCPNWERGGSLEELRLRISATKAVDQSLSGRGAAFRLSLPHSCRLGRRGAEKSTACDVTISLIDARTPTLSGIPRGISDLDCNGQKLLAACVSVIGNLKPPTGGSGRCGLSAGDGGGFGGRQLCSDHDEAIFDATRPLVFNAVPDLGVAGPRASRPCANSPSSRYQARARSGKRRSSGANSPRGAAHPGYLARCGLTGLRNLPHVKVDELPAAGGLYRLGDCVRRNLQFVLEHHDSFVADSLEVVGRWDSCG